MQFRKLTLLVAAFSVIALTFSACGNDDQPAKDEAKPEGVLQEISKEALGVVTIDDEFSEARDLIEGAGFVVASYGDFPSQEVSKKVRVLV